MNNNDIVLKFIKKSGLNPNLQLKKPIRGLPGYTIYDLVYSLILNSSVVSTAKYLGYSDNPVKQSIREVLHSIFPERKSEVFIGSGNKSSWRYCILQYLGCKECPRCYVVGDCNLFFNKNKSNSDGYSGWCKYCTLAESKLHKFYIAERTPSWSELDLISDFYSKCPKDYEVDHIIPLRGNNVSGLHVLSNLQYLPKQINRTKSNKYT